jgi:multidrug resistance protein, MATE family
MGEEANVPLLVPANNGDDDHLSLTVIHGDQGKAAAGDTGLLPAASAASAWPWAEVKGQLAFAAPMVATSMAYYAIPLVSVMFAGRLGDLQLAAATLGNSWGTVTGIALMVRASRSDRMDPTNSLHLI